MHVAEGDENDTDWVDSAYANNEYVEIQDPYPNEFEGEDWVDMTVVENITAEHTRCAPGNATDDLKVGDIFESKVKLLQALSEWSIVRSVSFKYVITNKKCYTAVCDANDVGSETRARGEFMLQSQKIQVVISKLKGLCKNIHATSRYFNPIIVRPHHPLCAISSCLW